MGADNSGELLSVTLTSVGLESALQGLSERVNELDARTRNQYHRQNKALDVQSSSAHAEHLSHLCETSGIQDLSKRTTEQQLTAMADAIVTMGQNINQFYKDVKYREAVQEETDTAQDEIMHMELDGIKNELEHRVSRKDASNMRKMMSVEMESMREEMKDDFAGKLSDINDKVSEHLQRVMEQVRTIQESAQATNGLLKDRIADAFLDIQSASEEMDTKIRKINSVFGICADPDEDPPSFDDMRVSLTDLQRGADAFRVEMAAQEASTTQLHAKLSEVQGALEERLETFAEAVQKDFGPGMAKVVGELETSMGVLEEKMEGKMSKRVGDCVRKIDELAEQTQKRNASTVAAEVVQETMDMRAKAQERVLNDVLEELRATMEENMDDRIKTVTREISVMAVRVEEMAAATTASADKINALGSTTKTLQKKLDAAQEASNKELAALIEKLTERVGAQTSDTGALSSEIGKLTVVVRQTQSRLDTLVTSSEKFVTTTTAGQAMLSEKGKALQKEVGDYKEENNDRMVSLQRSNISAVTTMRSLKRAVDALATKEGRWDRLEVQHKRHAQVLGGHLAELEGQATFAEPFSMSLPVQKHLSAVSQMVAKNIATRADYEITRQAVGRKNPAEDPDWDSKVEALRNRYLERFVGEVVEVANRLRPNTDRVVGEVRETFATKLTLSMKLAISKYKPIQAGATILGKVQLLPACMACDRPFVDNPGPGDQRSVVQDSRGEFREYSSNRSRSGSPIGGGGRSPGDGAFPAKGPRANSGGANKGGGVGSASPGMATSSFGGGDDDGSVTSMTSLADSQISGLTTSRYSNRTRVRDRSRDKYILRAGFKMRQASSEGGLVPSTAADRVGIGGNWTDQEDTGFDDMDASSANTSVTTNGRNRGKRRESGDGGPRDQINGSPLDLRPSTMSAAVGTRRERGNQHIHFKDQERVGGWVAGGGSGGVVDDGDDLSALPHDENASSEESLSVHLPNLR